MLIAVEELVTAADAQHHLRLVAPVQLLEAVEHVPLAPRLLQLRHQLAGRGRERHFQAEQREEAELGAAVKDIDFEFAAFGGGGRWWPLLLDRWIESLIKINFGENSFQRKLISEKIHFKENLFRRKSILKNINFRESPFKK